MDDVQTLITEMAAELNPVAKAAIKLRRRLHQYPEIGHQEFQTTALLKKELQKLGLKINDRHAATGLWAELDTGRKGPVVAVRTDIDALPVTEQTGLPFASKKNGFMHACGHDVHMSVLIGAARLLCRHKDKLVGKVKFICQPAEEVPPGGARPMIKAGVLMRPKVDAILALHVDPGLPTGSIGLRDGVTMAFTYDFDIKVIGKIGHAALPHKTVDAIAVGAEIVTGLQQVVSRMVDPIKPAVISFGIIRGGTVRNAIAGEMSLKGTARSLDPALTKKLPRLIEKTSVNIGRGLGARVEVKSVASYPPLKSNARVNRFIAESFKALGHRGKVHEIPLVMGGEDFACYLEKVPGAMFRLGIRNKKIGADKSWHHPAFIVDEDAIPIGIGTMAASVANILHNWRGGSR
jgi:amidohydrolase